MFTIAVILGYYKYKIKEYQAKILFKSCQLIPIYLCNHTCNNEAVLSSILLGAPMINVQIENTISHQVGEPTVTETADLQSIIPSHDAGNTSDVPEAIWRKNQIGQDESLTSKLICTLPSGVFKYPNNFTTKYFVNCSNLLK